MSRLKLFIVLGFGLMFVAGLEVGRAHTSLSSLKGDWNRVVANITGKPEPAPTTQPAKPDSHPLLFGEIQLTPAQDEQVHKIYRDAHAGTETLGRQMRDLDHRRDEEIIAMLDPVQKAEFDEIQGERDARMVELRAEIGAAMEKAGKEVRAILTPDQQKQYDQVKKRFDEMKDHGRHGGPPWPRGAGNHRPHGNPPDSAPAAAPETTPAAP